MKRVSNPFQRRHNFRVVTTRPVVLLDLSGTAGEMEAVTVDLSASGVQLEVSRALLEETRVSVGLNFDEPATLHLLLPGTVVRSGKRLGKNVIGVKFDKLDPERVQMLTRFVLCEEKRIIDSHGSTSLEGDFPARMIYNRHTLRARVKLLAVHRAELICDTDLAEGEQVILDVEEGRDFRVVVMGTVDRVIELDEELREVHLLLADPLRAMLDYSVRSAA